MRGSRNLSLTAIIQFIAYLRYVQIPFRNSSDLNVTCISHHRDACIMITAIHHTFSIQLQLQACKSPPKWWCKKAPLEVNLFGFPIRSRQLCVDEESLHSWWAPRHHAHRIHRAELWPYQHFRSHCTRDIAEEIHDEISTKSNVCSLYCTYIFQMMRRT